MGGPMATAMGRAMGMGMGMAMGMAMAMPMTMVRGCRERGWLIEGCSTHADLDQDCCLGCVGGSVVIGDGDAGERCGAGCDGWKHGRTVGGDTA